MNQTVITYGNMTILHCQTRRWENEHVTDVADIDHQQARLIISVEGFLRVSGNVGMDLTSGLRIAPNNFSDLSGQREQVAAISFGQREIFEMRYTAAEDGTGGFVYLRVLPQTTDGFLRQVTDGVVEYFDVAAGPKISDFQVLRQIGGTLQKVAVTFELNIVPCEPASQFQDNRVLINRWSARDHVDKNEYTTRTFHGMLRLSTPLVNPHLFRGIALPPKAPGLQREIEFEAGADGLSLNYTVTDREAPFAAPAPAKSWDVVHTETATWQLMSVGTLEAKFVGNRNVNKKELIALGMAIIETKLLNAGLNSIIDQLSVSDYISNETPATIVVRCDVRHQPLQDTKNFTEVWARVSGELGKPLTSANFGNTAAAGYDSNFPASLSGEADEANTAGLSGPVSLVGAVSVFLQDACGLIHDPFVGGLEPNLMEVALAPPDVGQLLPARVVETLPEELPPWQSVGHSEAPYTHYQIESKWDMGQTRLQLPIAEAQGNASAGDPTAVVVGLGLPATRRIVRVRAERIDEPPIIQAPDDAIVISDSTGSKVLKLLRAVVLPTYQVLIDGNVAWKADAEYVYAALQAFTANDDLRVGIDASLKGGVKYFAAGALNSLSENSNVP